MSQAVLEVRDVCKEYAVGKSAFVATDHVSFQIRPGEAFGLVGESGCGKSTLAKLITHLQPLTSGQILLNGEDITHLRGKALRETYRHIQMVFQDAFASFNPRKKIGASIREVLDNFECREKEQRKNTIPLLLEYVGLKPEHAHRLPHELSGGECQRAAIAKAIAIHPALLICDEATSALDVSVQAQIVNLLKSMGKEMNMTFLFISHDLALVSSFCDRVGVMYRGRLVETGTAAELLSHPVHPYTKLLLSSVFPVKNYAQWSAPGQIWKEAVEGCSCGFQNRCPHGAGCAGRTEPIRPVEVAPDHIVLCRCGEAMAKIDGACGQQVSPR